MQGFTDEARGTHFVEHKQNLHMLCEANMDCLSADWKLLQLEDRRFHI